MAIDSNAVSSAVQRLKRYKDGKARLERRIINNEDWWKLRQWSHFEQEQKSDYSEYGSAWLWNCIVSKHADIMDGFPEANILPRRQNDVEEAEKLSSIMPVEMALINYESVYSDVVLYLLKNGGAAFGIFWDGSKYNGLGDITVRKVDILELFWEPGVTDIQNSREVFYTKLVDRELLHSKYPDIKPNGRGFTVSEYRYDDNIPTENKAIVVDWYYKKYTGGRAVLHYCKFVDDIVLFSTENEPERYPNGLYDHGMFPFVTLSLFDIEGSIFGYGYTDIGKGDQQAIDILTAAILKNAKVNASPRFFSRIDGGINEDEFADWSKPVVHVEGSVDTNVLRQIEIYPLSAAVPNMRNELINELKETTGNRDVNNGSTTAGATAASAIAAMQEAAGKISRMHNKTMYNAHRQVTLMCIELIRQFFDLPREFRLTGKMGEQQFAQYTNAGIKPDTENGKAEFDVEVTAQKATPYSKMEQNELAIQLYNLGVFNPQNAQQAVPLLQFMDFKGRDKAMQIVQGNFSMFQKIQALQQMCLTMAQQIGDPKVLAEIQQVFAMDNAAMTGQISTPGAAVQPVSLESGESSVTANARQRAQEATQV